MAPVSSALEAAERALASVPVDPNAAKVAALELLTTSALDPESASIAERTVGLVERDVGHLAEARRRMRRAISIAEVAGLAERAAQARISLAHILLQAGEPSTALAELEYAAAHAPRTLLGPVFAQQALILIRAGRFDEALDASRRALPLLRRAGDRVTEARVLSNRGVLHGHRGELGLAEADLGRALAIYRELGSAFAGASVLHNLGYVAALAGDVPAALRQYDEAEREFAALGVPLPNLFVDRAELLLSVQLLPEARRQIDLGVAALQEAGAPLDLAEARLLHGQIALAEGDLPAATSSARSARRQLDRQGRGRWAVLAGFVEAQSRWAAGGDRRRVPEQALELADQLSADGWVLPSLECRVIGARAALRAAHPEVARMLLAGVERGSRSASSAQRVRGWYAEALLRLSMGNRPGALAALRRGLEVAEEHRATLGATELRVRTATTVSELADLGLGLAFQSGRAFDVLRWSERWRAGALRAPRATPPADSRLATLLARLRDTVARLEQVSLEGGDGRALVDQQRKIEAEIRQRSRRASGDFAGAYVLPDAPSLRHAIGERALVEFIEREGRLHAIVGTRRGFRLCALGPAADAVSERAALQFALSRLALRRSPQPSLDAAAVLLERSCRRLDELLFDPLGREVQGRDLIVVPTGELHALPWALLPSSRGRTMTVSPSASLWYSRQGAESRHQPQPSNDDPKVVLVAGPRVAQAEAEIGQLRSSYYKCADVLQGSAATARQVARSFEGRRLAHVAAHGTFRADNAQFSSLELADGPLTVYDLERIAQPPEWMVLSACDAGRSEVHPGDELMGTSAALLSLGTRAIVSSVAPVPDDGATPVMVALHGELARGSGLAAALAKAQADALPPGLEAGDLASGDEASRAALAAGAFVCLGAG